MRSRVPAQVLTLLLLGLASGASRGEESLGDDWGDDWGEDDATAALRWTGFLEAAYGRRLQDDDAIGQDITLAEIRGQIETEYIGDVVTARLRADLYYDEVLHQWETDRRELSLAFSPAAMVDVKLGTQVLTWGTGDLLFLNDLFPKDWQSFFAGRDVEYLKAPSDTVRTTVYLQPFNIDFAWTPVFESDSFLTGERFSFYSPFANGFQGGIVAPDPPLDAKNPPEGLDDGEFALRLYKTLAGTEYAAYGYRGYWKSPEGTNEDFKPIFPRLQVWGASLRRNLLRGLFNAEFAYYNSSDDNSGKDPLIPNSQLRGLVAYEQELVTNLTGAAQFYTEHTLKHDELEDNSLNRAAEPDEWLVWITLRLTYRAMQDNLIWSFFGFVSPSDEDYYLRPSVTYRYSDALQLVGGANLFGGQDEHTFFGQLEDNSNAYLRVRCNF